MFQSSLPVLLFLPQNTTLLLRGGTNVSNSPATEYIEYILLPFLQRHFSIDCQIETRTRGFSSRGGGELFVRVERLRRKLRCVRVLERGEIVEFIGIVWSARREYKNVTRPPWKSFEEPTPLGCRLRSYQRSSLCSTRCFPP